MLSFALKCFDLFYLFCFSKAYANSFTRYGLFPILTKELNWYILFLQGQQETELALSQLSFFNVAQNSTNCQRKMNSPLLEGCLLIYLISMFYAISLCILQIFHSWTYSDKAENFILIPFLFSTFPMCWQKQIKLSSFWNILMEPHWKYKQIGSGNHSFRKEGNGDTWVDRKISTKQMAENLLVPLSLTQRIFAPLQQD